MMREPLAYGRRRGTMKCTGGRVVRFLVCLQVFRPSPVISTVRRLEFMGIRTH